MLSSIIMSTLSLEAWKDAIGPIDAVDITVPFETLRPISGRNVTCIWLRNLFQGGPDRVNAEHHWISGVPALDELPAQYRGCARLSLVGPLKSEATPLARRFASAVKRLGWHPEHNRPSVSIEPPQIEPVRHVLSAPLDQDTYNVHIRSPLVIKRARSAPDTPQVPWLGAIALLARIRIERLAFGHGDRPPPVDLSFLSDIEALEDRLHERRFTRTRSAGERYPVSGLQGRSVLRGPGLERIAPLLTLGGRLGIGKATAFGFGQFTVRAEL